MSKSFSNEDGTSSRIDPNVPSRDGNSYQDNKYTWNDSDAGKANHPKVHEYVERDYSTGTVKSGGRGEKFNSKSSDSESSENSGSGK